MSFTVPDASTLATLTTRADARRRPAMNLGQIARTVVLLLAGALAFGAMTRQGHAAPAGPVDAIEAGAAPPASARD